MPNPDEVKRKYRKGISVNKFSKYKQVMESLHERSKTVDQKSMRTKSHSCNRIGCQKKASTFYMIPQPPQGDSIGDYD